MSTFVNISPPCASLFLLASQEPSVVSAVLRSASSTSCRASPSYLGSSEVMVFCILSLHTDGIASVYSCPFEAKTGCTRQPSAIHLPSTAYCHVGPLRGLKCHLFSHLCLRTSRTSRRYYASRLTQSTRGPLILLAHMTQTATDVFKRHDLPLLEAPCVFYQQLTRASTPYGLRKRTRPSG